MASIIANRYEVGPKIGSGGMGDVFEGIDQQTHTPVAIKMLKSVIATPEMITRFKREGEALRQLNHPNIVMLLDALEAEGEHYLIMEYVDGGALDEKLRNTPQIPLKQMLNLALDLTDALTRAHRLNIIHRDIKPANVLLTRDGTPRLTDFGIARVSNSDITEDGRVLGTITYIAPEVLEGSPADVRSDIWSLGILFYEMLAGSVPFKGLTLSALMHAILHAPLPDLETLRPDAPVALIDLINRMVIKNPNERIPRMRLVGAELEAILSGDRLATDSKSQATAFEPAPANRFATSAPQSTRSIRNNLPSQTTPFVGREHELVELERLLHDPALHLLTVVAPGGMGKTRLSLEVASQMVTTTAGHALFVDGIFMVDLAPLTSPDNIPQAVAEGAGYAFQQDGRDPAQQILDFLREKHVLLLMDNFEHVIAGRALVQNILQSAPGVKVLATSRERLNLNAETTYILSGMDFPEWETPEDALDYGAVKLFMQSARRVRPDFRLGADDLAYVARICRLVQGTPLGILLAAAWLEALSPAEIAQEIAQSLDFLETEMHDLPERQRSLRAVFEYSWSLLSDQERAVFASFSIFRGGFTREAAQQIIEANLRTLTTLTNKSLLRRDNVSGRYEVHELLRQYAEEKLATSPDIDRLRNAHSHYYSAFVAKLTPAIMGNGQLEALNALETDFENLRTAWTWLVKMNDAEGLQPMLEGMYLFLLTRNRFMDGEQLFGMARHAWPANAPDAPLIAEQVLVRYAEAPTFPKYEQGLMLAERHQDAFEIAFCKRLMGHWRSHSEFNQDEGIPLMEAALQIFRDLGKTYYVALTLDDLGWSYNLMLQQGKQQALVNESLSLRRALGDRIGIANCLRNLGGSVGGYFDPTDRAVTYWQEAKTIAYEMNDRLGIAWNAVLQAVVYLFHGEFEHAQSLVDEAQPHALYVNEPVVKGMAAIARGLLLALRDEDYTGAMQQVEAGYPKGVRPDLRITIAAFCVSLVACATRRFELLQYYVMLFLDTPPFNVDGFFVPLFLHCRVVKLFDEGHYARAASLIRAGMENLRSYVDTPFPTGWLRRWPLFIRLLAELKAKLGAEAFDASWEQGKALTLTELAQETDGIKASLSGSS